MDKSLVQYHLTKVALVLITVFVVVVALIGFKAYQNSLYWTLKDSSQTLSEDLRIKKIENVSLPKTFLYRLPEFLYLDEEHLWWQSQRNVEDAARDKTTVTIEALTRSDVLTRIQLYSRSISSFEAIKDLGLNYVVTAIFLVSAYSVFVKHKTVSGLVLCGFFLCCALYIASATPIVHRSLTIPYEYLKFLVNCNYIASAGLITLVHYAIVFPNPKPILIKYTIKPWHVFYGYMFGTIFCYFSGISAFASSVPLFLIWIPLLIWGFSHSLWTEKDTFLRRQIALSLFAPILVTVFYVAFNVVPSVLGVSAMRFTYFALFCLILPFALISAMDNVRLYKQRIAAEQRTSREKEKIRRDLHDNVLNDLASISHLSESSKRFIGKDNDTVERLFSSITEFSDTYSKKIRGLLWVTDDKCNHWEEFASQLRRLGYDMIGDRNIDFDLVTAIDNTEPPASELKIAVYNVFVEILQNAIKHSDSAQIRCQLDVDEESLNIQFSDDGIGFDQNHKKEGHYGLQNLKSRVSEFNGEIKIDSVPQQGTQISIVAPVMKNTAIEGLDV